MLTKEELDRNYGEILQEVRVAQTGVQLLLAFLLTLAFTPAFGQFTLFQRDIYVAALVLGAASTGLLIAPASFHRLVYRRRLKRELVRISSRFTTGGLFLLMLALAAALMLILDVVLGTLLAVWITTGLVGWFSIWWYVVPLSFRLLARHEAAAHRLACDVAEVREDVRHVSSSRVS